MPVLEALGRAVPGPAVLQSDVRRKAEEVLAVLAPQLLDKMDVFETTGIRKRHFVRPLDWFLEPHGWAERSDIYRDVGLAILEEATREALAAAGLDAREVDGVVLVSTTGLATPSLDARLANRVGLRADVVRVPVWGLGCVGGVAGLNVAADLARAHPTKRFLLLSMELCSLAFNLSDISVRAFVANTLFADGCAAALVRGDDARGGPAGLARVLPGASHQWRDTEDVMGWDVTDEGLRVVFSRRIPDLVAKEYAPVVEAYLKREALSPARHLYHPGGTKVLEAYESALGLPRDVLDESRHVLREYGNMSSPTVLFVVEEALRRRALAPGEVALLGALGPGFTASLCALEGLAPR
ncbi:MAG TPA: 3-oxoacyl-[acyl-carrier-protein] synthase III C-terminal domain-containing protein [Candidatus Thermoplasmatota archaeon]|nr:3-oxoacyl-[acyl-carrier-protein] synthase III C-terminal domain-containing protein [Candidatus Thermoplasmatota archaeon]